MVEQSSGFGKRKLWIGGGIAAVAALLAVSYVSNFPPGAQNAMGTIVPAQRYIAPQAQDINVGNQAGTSSQAGIERGGLSGTTNGVLNGTTNGTTNGVLNGTTNATLNGTTNGTLNSAPK